MQPMKPLECCSRTAPGRLEPHRRCRQENRRWKAPLPADIALAAPLAVLWEVSPCSWRKIQATIRLWCSKPKGTVAAAGVVDMRSEADVEPGGWQLPQIAVQRHFDHEGVRGQQSGALR